MAKHLAGTANQQVLFGNIKAVIAFTHDIQPLFADKSQRWVIQQQAETLVGTATYPAAQLVQLGKAEALGVFDDHQAGVGHIDANFDHRGCHQQVCLAGLKRRHDGGFLIRGHAAVDQAHPQLRQLRR